MENEKFISCGWPVLIFVGMIFIMLAFEKHTTFYMDGVRDTKREAYEHGLMIKTLDKDDKVVYSWKELHNIGYEEEK